MKIRNGLVAMLLIWMLCGSMISVIPERVKASSETIVTITLQPEPPRADVSPGSLGSVTLIGTVYCLKYGPDDVKVSLTATSETGGAYVFPSSFVIDGTGGSEETRSFAVTARVPQGTTFLATPTVTVSGQFIQGDMQYPISPVNQLIVVLPYYKIYAESPGPTEAVPGENVKIPVKITNLGNTNDTFEFIFENIENLVNTEWHVKTIPPQTFYPNQTKTIMVNAPEIKKRTEDTTEILPFTFRIISQKSHDEGGDVKYFAPIYIRVKEHFICGFIPPFMLIVCITITMVFAWRGWDQNEKVRRGDI